MIAPSLARAAGLFLGAAADAVVGDPRRGHPVAGFGALAAALERRGYADRRGAGVRHVALLVGGAVVLGVVVERVAVGFVGRTVVTAAATWVVLGGTSLAREGSALAGELDRGDLAAARARLPGLCGRDPSTLDAGGLARAGTESMAENTSDAVVAPLLWGAVAGVPGLLGYRAVNTLDAMVGHRSPRYARFGWAAARLDDAANLVPARVCALSTAAVAPLVGGSPRSALRAWRRDAAAHPSPNAGPVEAAAAGALGVTLGGRTVYAHAVEERPRLGEGPPPGPADLRRAVRLGRLVSAAATVVAVAAATARPTAGRLRHRRRRPAHAAGPPCGTGGRPSGAAASRGG